MATLRSALVACLAAVSVGEAIAEFEAKIKIDLGDDTSNWANNNVCDDPRFDGVGVDEILTPQDIGKDASDCRLVLEAGLARVLPEHIDFGDNSGDLSLIHI